MLYYCLSIAASSNHPPHAIAPQPQHNADLQWNAADMLYDVSKGIGIGRAQPPSLLGCSPTFWLPIWPTDWLKWNERMNYGSFVIDVRRRRVKVVY